MAGGREIAHPDFEGFWARAEELGALVFIHPWGCTLGHRLDEHYLANVVGNPTETTVALSHIIFSGLLDRRPGLRILAAHGGGYLPFYIGRSDHAWQHRPDSQTPRRRPASTCAACTSMPSSTRRRRSPRSSRQVGADRVMVGTDYPFDMGIEDPVDRLRAAPLDDAQREAIRGGNAAALGLVPA